MTRCASPLSNFPPEGERAIASSPASGRGLRRGGATGAGMTAVHLLMELLANPLRQQAGKWLVIPQSAGFAITSDLVRVVCVPSRMASCFISNVSEVRS
jgi:hypothetical protein